MIRKLLPWFDQEPQLSRRSFLGWTGALGAALALPRLLLPQMLVAPEPDPADLQALIDAMWRAGGGAVPIDPSRVYELGNRGLLMRPGVDVIGAALDPGWRGISFPRERGRENQCKLEKCRFASGTIPHFNLYDLPRAKPWVS